MQKCNSLCTCTLYLNSTLEQKIVCFFKLPVDFQLFIAKDNFVTQEMNG